MKGGELLEAAGAQPRQGQAHDPLVGLIRAAVQESRRFGSVDESDNAVGPQLKVLGHIAHGRRLRPRMAAHREQQLMVSGRQADGDGLLLAEPKEAAQPVTELEQPLVFGVAQARHPARRYRAEIER
jgi:hypothetical protein